MIDTAIHQLREHIHGEVFEPGDAGYTDTCTLFNAAIERSPAIVVRPDSTADIVEALRFARANALPLAVRSGGHSAAGWSLCDDGLVLDMRSFDSIEVDTEARTAKVGGGCITGAVDRACQEHGLAVVTGRVSTTGIAGFTLGGGSGVLERRFGFAVDNLLAVELVTAGGESDRRRARHPFRAVLGAARGRRQLWRGHLAHLPAHPIEPVVTGGLILYDGDRGIEVLRHARTVMETAPEHLGAVHVLPCMHPTTIDSRGASRPAGVRPGGQPLRASRPAEKDLAPLREFGPPAVDFVEETTWADLHCRWTTRPASATT